MFSAIIQQQSMNVQALMSLLGLYSESIGTLNNSVQAFIVELHQQNHHLFIKLLYKYDDNHPPQVIVAPGESKTN